MSRNGAGLLLTDLHQRTPPMAAAETKLPKAALPKELSSQAGPPRHFPRISATIQGPAAQQRLLTGAFTAAQLQLVAFPCSTPYLFLERVDGQRHGDVAGQCMATACVGAGGRQTVWLLSMPLLLITCSQPWQSRARTQCR